MSGAPHLLIDGLNLAYRSFYAMPPLTRSDGFPTGALHGWIKTVTKLVENENPKSITVFFDLGGSEARLAAHPTYKAQRPEMPKELAQQLPEIKTLCRLLGYSIVEKEGIEADDLLGVVALHYWEKGEPVAIISADKDFAQLLRPGITQFVPPPTANPKIGWQKLDPQGVETKWGIRPDQVVDYLSLIGDSSDNIPGIPGVGPKTAANWLQAWQSLEGIFSHIESLRPERFRPLLIELKDTLRLNQSLISLHIHHPLPAFSRVALQPEALKYFLQTMEMKQSLAAIEKQFPNSNRNSYTQAPQQGELF